MYKSINIGFNDKAGLKAQFRDISKKLKFLRSLYCSFHIYRYTILRETFVNVLSLL